MYIGVNKRKKAFSENLDFFFLGSPHSSQNAIKTNFKISRIGKKFKVLSEFFFICTYFWSARIILLVSSGVGRLPLVPDSDEGAVWPHTDPGDLLEQLGGGHEN